MRLKITNNFEICNLYPKKCHGGKKRIHVVYCIQIITQCQVINNKYKHVTQNTRGNRWPKEHSFLPRKGDMLLTTVLYIVILSCSKVMRMFIVIVIVTVNEKTPFEEEPSYPRCSNIIFLTKTPTQMVSPFVCLFTFVALNL